jgi:hypothetical protein
MPTAKELETFKKAIIMLMGQDAGAGNNIINDDWGLLPSNPPSNPLKKDIIDSVIAPLDVPDVTMERYTKLVRNEIKVERSQSNSYIIVVANQSPMDDMLKIHCQGGTAISGYVYDHLNDCYCIRGIDYCSLGYVPISFRLTMEHSNWNISVPTPENVLRRFMTKKQKTDLKNFKEHYKNCKIFFLQLVD